MEKEAICMLPPEPMAVDYGGGITWEAPRVFGALSSTWHTSMRKDFISSFHTLNR